MDLYTRDIYRGCIGVIGYSLVPKKHDSHIGHKKNSESWDDGYNERMDRRRASKYRNDLGFRCPLPLRYRII